MLKRDLKSGLIGATMSAVAVLGIGRYGGHVVGFAAGEARSPGEGPMSVGGPHATGGSSGDGGAALAHAGDDPVEKANENLVEQVSEYRRRLESIAAEKVALEASLKKSEEKLAAAESDGGVGKRRNEWDLTQGEWADLAKKGQVNWRTPCYDRDGWSPSPDALKQLGLSTQDGAAIRDAYERSYQRLWAQIRPICSQELGSPSAELLERIGPDACVHLVYDIEIAIDKNAAMEAHTEVAEIRAGLRPEPAAADKVHPVLKLFLLVSRANAVFEADLAKSFGPDEAHLLAYADDLCHDSKRVGGGVKREPAR
jgi:hypothetical protein